MKTEFNLKGEFGLLTKEIRYEIRKCQRNNHIQQVAFSTYHNSLTQICFTCKKIRTELAGEELKK